MFDPPRPLSRVFIELANAAGDHITLDQIASELSDRSYGALMVLFSLPNLLPLPPGSSTVFAIPLILIAVQLLIGRPRVWLPRVLRDRSIDKPTFLAMTERIEPTLRRLEKLARPRYWPIPRVVGERIVGALVLLMALILVLPIPLGNWLPALAVVIISLALTERDGIWFAVGLLVSTLAIGVVVGVVGSIGLAAFSLFA